MKLSRLACGARRSPAAGGLASGQGKDIRIAHIYDKTGPLEAYAKQTHIGLMMGLEYATGGTMTVAAARSSSSRRTTRASPTWARRCSPPPTATTRSTSPSARPSRGVALAMLPVAEEYKKILLVEPAVADSITGDKWNRYIFRTGRNSLAGRDLQRGRARQGRTSRSRRWRRTTPSAGTASRPSRRRSPAPARRSCTRSTRRSTTTDFTAPARSASSTR